MDCAQHRMFSANNQAVLATTTSIRGRQGQQTDKRSWERGQSQHAKSTIRGIGIECCFVSGSGAWPCRPERRSGRSHCVCHQSHRQGNRIRSSKRVKVRACQLKWPGDARPKRPRAAFPRRASAPPPSAMTMRPEPRKKGTRERTASHRVRGCCRCLGKSA